MLQKIILCAALLAACYTGSAQKVKPRFQSSVAGGLAVGESAPALQLQTINGFRYKTWWGGIGVGLDYYHTRSVPLFIGVRKRFSEKPKSAFLYLDGGYNIPWLMRSDKGFLFVKEKGGLYADGGAGFQVPVGKKAALFFTAGYSVKQFTSLLNQGIYSSVFPPPRLPYSSYKYTLSRISLKAGIRF